MTAEYLMLKTRDCKHCYKCIRDCPVKAIKFSGNKATIIQEECVLCGRCFVSCPQNAKSIRNDIAAAKELIQSGARVYASLAPSFLANYAGHGIGDLRAALSELGFYAAEETALGAVVVKARYDELVEEGERKVIISSCCHSVNTLIQKHFPAALPFVAAVMSPMQAHCAEIKRKDPESRTVFIGPCISKKAEAEQYPGIVDCALTFEELSAWMREEGVSLAEPHPSEAPEGKTRLFPLVGGILRSMRKANPNYSYIAVDGMENCIEALRDLSKGDLSNCFIEMSACGGGCIGGPVMEKGNRLIKSYTVVDSMAGCEDFAVELPPAGTLHKDIRFMASARPRFGEKSVADVLRKIGKTEPEDELNCGSCGYNTCRDKAEAVLTGKADLTMCLPYLMGKAESFSDTIIQNTPNGVLVLNEALEVQQINAAACKLMNINNDKDVLGRHVVCVLDPAPFAEALENGRNLYDKRQYFAEYDRYVMQTVILDKSYNLIIGIFRDVTQDTADRAAQRELRERTVEVTDRVIEKQMRTVQEIASLLGETAAETKIALTKLKETLNHE